MLSNQYRVAGSLLVKSLSRIRSMQNGCDKNSQTGGLNEEGNLTVEPLTVIGLDQESSSYFLYKCAFSASCTNDVFVAGDNIIARLASVLLYNTGLCYQAMGMMEGTEQAFFHKALKLYDLAVAVLDASHEANRLVRFAALNNKGFIMTYFFEYEAAQECLSCLQDLLTTCKGPEDELFREDTLEVRMNLALNYGMRQHAAAA